MVTDKRAYSSDLRAEQANATRRRIVEAGSRLFAEQGYAATTIDAVATRAGVSRKTVFTAVGGKVELIKLAYDWAIAGDDEPVARIDRPEIRRLQEEADPVALLAEFVRLLDESLRRVVPVHAALVAAADVDEEAGALLARLEQQRALGMGWMARDLATRGFLRDGLTVDRARDLLWFHIQPVHWDLLVNQRGWSRRAYRKWLTATLVHDLLGVLI